MKNEKEKRENDLKKHPEKKLEEIKKLKKIVNSLVLDILNEETLLKEIDGPLGAFLGPLSDIVNTAKYGIKKLSTVAGRNALKITGHLAMLMIPFIASSEIKKIDKIIQKQIDTRLSQLDNEYKDVLQRNMQALQARDISIFAFFTNPSTYLAAATGMAGISAAVSLFEILTMGSPEAVALRKKIDNFSATTIGYNGIKNTSSTGNMAGNDFGGDYGGDYGGMYENAQTLSVSNLKKEIASDISNLLKSPGVQNAIKNNPLVQVVDNSKVDAVVGRVSELMKIKKYEDLKKFMGADFYKFENKILSSKPKDMNQQENDTFNQNLVSELKKSYKQVYVKYLSDMLNSSNNADRINKAIQFVNKLN